MESKMKKIFILIILTGLISCSDFLSSSNDDYFSTNLSGIVSNEDDNQPIENAKVYVFRTYSYNNGKHIVHETEILAYSNSDENGLYNLKAIKLQKGKIYKVAAEKVGYQDSKYYCAPQITILESQRIDIQLRKF
jgi:hypothetical protein